MISEKGVPKFDRKIYSRVALNELVTYAVYFLSQSSNEIPAEDIVAACFLLFPQRFALRGYPQWPDSTVVNKRWIDCRKRGLISGSTAQGFVLTPAGLKVAERVGKMLGGQHPLSTRRDRSEIGAEIRTRAGRFLRHLEESDAYRQFRQEEERALISEFDFRSMLLCTMESSASTLQRNLEQFKQYSALYERKDLSQFLEFCEKRFRKLLSGAPAETRQYKGGMLRKKLK